jgi:predicted O-methyltransferase YrrM
MANRSIELNESTYNYLLSVSLREPQILQELRRETATLSNAVMQIAPEQGQFMSLLVKLLNVKKALEVGVFTGYSSLCVALALPKDGKLIACDVSDDYTSMARRYWEKAGVAEKIDLRIAPALDTLDKLIAMGESNSFDFAFIDADKSNYPHYYDRILQLLRPQGLILVDNVLWSGKVADTEVKDNRTQQIRNFNEKLYRDDRIDLSLLPIADGLTIAMKK